MLDGNQNKILEKYGDVLTPDEIREILKIGRTKLYEILRREDIPSFRIGRNYRVLKSDILIYLSQSK